MTGPARFTERWIAVPREILDDHSAFDAAAFFRPSREQLVEHFARLLSAPSETAALIPQE